MIDSTTHQRLQVSTDGGAAPYLMLPDSQLAQVRDLLERNKIRHWVDEETLSMDGGPEIAWINLSRGVVPELVQKLLDSLRNP